MVQSKKKLREIRKQEVKKRREELWAEVNNSKDMESFWKAIKKYRKRRQGGGGNISAERFVDHFNGLLGGENRDTRQKVNSEKPNEGQREKSRDRNESEKRETEKLNVSLTVKEVLDEIKRLKMERLRGGWYSTGILEKLTRVLD